MSKVLFYIIVQPLSYAPFWVLYRISDVIFLLIYYLFKYRKVVVLKNITNSFPNKSKDEINSIAKSFYRHFCDLIVEAIKMFGISERELIRRCKIRNPELLQHYFDLGKSVIIPAGHYGNWEMAATASNLQIAHQTVGVYSPLKNPFVNHKIAESRARFGLELVPINELKTFFKEYHGSPMAVLFGSDQCREM